MKTKKILFAILGIGLTAAGIVIAADHTDAPSITGKSTDITDMYVFQGSNTNNMVFVANTQGLLSPSATTTATFDDNTMIQFDIDNTGDNVEDLVIQCVFSKGTMYVYGPVAPSQKGLMSKVEGNLSVSVPITAYGVAAPTVATQNGISAFAGPRDDPFFFDLNSYKHILDGTQPNGFKNPGDDTFKGTNVLSAVIEVPKSLLGTGVNGKINVWVEAKRKI